MSEKKVSTHFTLNGVATQRDVPVRLHLVDFLREELGLTGSHLGCEHGVGGVGTAGHTDRHLLAWRASNRRRGLFPGLVPNGPGRR